MLYITNGFANFIYNDIMEIFQTLISACVKGYLIQIDVNAIIQIWLQSVKDAHGGINKHTIVYVFLRFYVVLK